MAEKIILIVDDEKEVLAYLDKKLTQHQFRVFTATHGREAIEMAKIHQPGLILMDIVLPDLAGPEAVKLIKEDPTTRHIPVIFFSGIVSKEDEHTRTGVQVDGIKYRALAKPFTFKDLYVEIEKIFGNE